uniref:hypothetical protein n=1 Tax=Deinococcus sp. TaxID=47478 RepID=UPI002869A4E1
MLRLRDPRVVSTQLDGFRHVFQGDIRGEIHIILTSTVPDDEKLEQVWGVGDAPTVDRFLFQDGNWASFNRRLWQESPAQ